jgi:hypothetical protein
MNPSIGPQIPELGVGNETGGRLPSPLVARDELPNSAGWGVMGSAPQESDCAVSVNR